MFMDNLFIFYVYDYRTLISNIPSSVRRLVWFLLKFQREILNSHELYCYFLEDIIIHRPGLIKFFGKADLFSSLG
jgi:hypothetical protein